MNNHTLGPWEIFKGGIYSVPIRKQIEPCTLEDGRIVHAGLVALVYGDHYNEQREYTVDANRTLIAAAPDLLEALKDAMTWFSKLEDWSGVGDPDLDKYRAAIAKAEGTS